MTAAQGVDDGLVSCVAGFLKFIPNPLPPPSKQAYRRCSNLASRAQRIPFKPDDEYKNALTAHAPELAHILQAWYANALKV